MIQMRFRQEGFTLIELLIVVAIIGLLAGIAIPLVTQYRQHGKIAAILSESRTLYSSFELYYEENMAYPAALDLTSFAPLTFNGSISAYLLNGKADAYAAPNDNQEFWMQMTLADNPSIQFIIVYSDDAPLAAGKQLNGVYRFDDGVMQMK